MKRVYLFCSAGMSTSMLASKMQGIANSHDLPIEVEAFPDGKIGQIIDEKHPDVILLGPQVKYRYGEIVESTATRVSRFRSSIRRITDDERREGAEISHQAHEISKITVRPGIAAGPR